jgi:uncharacterized membrane protein YfcA
VLSVIDDPWFYVAAVPAIVLFGVSKGGFGAGFGVIAVPLIALVTSPVQAAAILLPILCLMDLFALWAYRRKWVWPELRLLIPASLIGISIGTFLFEYMSPAIIRLILGIVAITFTLNHWFHLTTKGDLERSVYPPVIGTIAAATAGFTSFVAHAGGPPLDMYLLRRKLDRTAFVGTTVAFFAVANYVKLIPYAWLGQLDGSNLSTSLVLSPLAPIGIGLGVWLHRRVSDRIFFHFVYTMLFVVGLKLVYDGLGGL